MPLVSLNSFFRKSLITYNKLLFFEPINTQNHGLSRIELLIELHSRISASHASFSFWLLVLTLIVFEADKEVEITVTSHLTFQSHNIFRSKIEVT